MKITIESTDKLTHHNGTLVRVWRGTTENGTPCTLFVAGLAVDKRDDTSEFDRALRQTDAPVEIRHIADVIELRETQAKLRRILDERLNVAIAQLQRKED